jgi:hypothetical protein
MLKEEKSRVPRRAAWNGDGVFTARYRAAAPGLYQLPVREFSQAGTVSPKLVSNFIGCWRCDW